MSKIRIAGGAILALSEDMPRVQHGDVLIEGDRIAALGPHLAAEDALQIDATGCVVMPGLVNAHLHGWQTPLRGIAADWTLADYLQRILGELAPRFLPQDIYEATHAAALDQIDAGVTTMIDWCHNAPTPAHAEAALAGLRDAGIRALFLRGAFAAPHDAWADVAMPSQTDSLLTLGMSILGPAYAPLDTVRGELRRARERDEVVSMHFAGLMASEAFGQLAREGLITPKVNIVHGNGMGDDALRALADHGATFTVTPEVEMQMGFGPGITGRLRALGARPSLGVDTETSSSSDLFQVMRFALQLQRYVDHQNAVEQTGQPLAAVSIKAREALQWATVEGARAAGLDARTGTLAPGKQADLILVRVPGIAPGLDLAQLIVSRANTSDIDTVIVNGRLKKQHGRRLGTPRADMCSKLSRIAQRILSA